MNKINNFIVVNTYFHVQQIKLLDFASSSNSIIYYSHYMDENIIKNLLADINFKLIKLPKYSFSKKQFLDNVFQSVNNTRKLIKEIKIFINNICIEDNKKYNLIIFTEKDLFNQVLLAQLYKKKNIKLISVDEGIGHYRISHNTKEKMINFLYNVFSLIFFQFKFNYVVALGRDPRLDAIYLRFPMLVDYTKNVHKLPAKKNKHNIYKKNNNLYILIFTSPLSEDNYMNPKDEKKILQELCEIFIKKGYKVEIKPHPREVKQKYSHINGVNIIQNNLQVSDLELYKYTYIVNFGSSIVLELFAMGYDLNKIITYNFVFDIELYPLFKYTIIIANSNQLKKIVYEN